MLFRIACGQHRRDIEAASEHEACAPLRLADRQRERQEADPLGHVRTCQQNDGSEKFFATENILNELGINTNRNSEPRTSQPLSILTCDCLTPVHPHEPTKKLWLKLYEAHARRGDHDTTWHFASRKDKPEIFGGTGVDAVVIVPLLVTPDGKWRLVVIKEYRIPIAGYEIGFPAGLIDPTRFGRRTPLDGS
jgi:hypothetical protein